MTISLPSHHNRTTHIRTETKKITPFFIRPTLPFTQKSQFGFEVKMKRIENIQEFRALSAWNILFAHSLHAGLQKGRTKEPLTGPGAFKRRGYFLRPRICGEAQKLSVCYKSVKCFGTEQDKFQLTTLLLR